MGRKGRGGEGKGRKGTHSGLDLVPLLFCGSTPMAGFVTLKHHLLKEWHFFNQDNTDQAV